MVYAAPTGNKIALQSSCARDGISQLRGVSLSKVIALTGRCSSTSEEEEAKRGLWLTSQGYECVCNEDRECE